MRTWRSFSKTSVVRSSFDGTPPKSLYRYMPLIQLISIIESGSITLVNPAAWPDKTEGGWISKLFGENGILPGVHARALCLTRESYSEALWHVYAKTSPVVRVRIDVEILLQDCLAYAKDHACKLYLGDVRYQTSAEMRQALEDHIDKDISSTAATLLSLKRRAFAYEREVRLAWFGRGNISEQISIPMSVEDMVSQILVSPYADDWAVEALTSLINESYGLSWSVEKSSLDRAPKWMSG
jgi:hypothetical protein